MSDKSERVHALVNTGPWPGMSDAFDAYMGAACWTDPVYAPDAATWAAAWKAAKRGAEAIAREVAQARETAEYWKAEHLAGNARIGELHDELAQTALRSADHLRKAIKLEARAAELATDAQRYRILRNCNMDVRNRLEHYGGDALDERLDALNILALGPNVEVKAAREWRSP